MTTPTAVVVPCVDVAEEVEYFESLGWRVADVFPADDPSEVTLDGHGVRLRLTRGPGVAPRLVVPETLVTAGSSPSGVVLEPAASRHEVPPLVSSWSVTTGDEPWHVGRAGMHYRDLVPDRQGGAVIASHIRIPTGGPVPDYPHFHDVVFQLIVVHKGWVRLAYEGQGEPFVLRAGECVIQPPMIRHRVLESSDELHVVEVGYPAEHLTRADHDFDFRTSPIDPDRQWNGQRFVRYTLDQRSWSDLTQGVRESDTGIADATSDRADVRLIEMESTGEFEVTRVPDGVFTMVFVLDGRVMFEQEGRANDTQLVDGSNAVVPVGSTARFMADAPTKLLVVRIDTIR